MDQMSIEILSDCVMPYIGHYHFRFVAGVNRTFYLAYTTYTANHSNVTCSSQTPRYHNRDRKSVV